MRIFFFGVFGRHYQWCGKTRQTAWSIAQGLSQLLALLELSQAQGSLLCLNFAYQLPKGEEEGEGNNLECKALIPNFSQCPVLLL